VKVGKKKGDIVRCRTIIGVVSVIKDGVVVGVIVGNGLGIKNDIKSKCLWFSWKV
jgi:hypothetical protein